MALTSGTKLGPYEIQSPLGAGGMGEVYRATDKKLGRDIALKVLPAEMAEDPERLARFRREAKALAQLDHPNIVTIHSVEESDGVHFLTMQLVEGQPLDRLICAGGLPLEQIVEIASALGDALAAAHEKGIVHRDLKPANVMVSNEGRVKVLDFGLAKDVRASNLGDATLTSTSNTQVGVVMGTPAYMSPEQASGRPLDHRTDIFSLGVLLHEIATGRRPFEGSSSAELVSAILRDTPPPVTDLRPDLPSDLARIIRRCLEKEPRYRVQTARDVSNEFRDLARSTARPAPLSPSTPRASVAADSGAARAEEGFWVAVLPFRYTGSNADLKALAEGLSEEVITGLSRFSYLRVIARGSTAKYSSESGDVRAIGKEVGARYVMEGSVRQAGARLRVTVQLGDAASGVRLWTETYERAFDPEAVFTLQDDLVPRIVSTVADSYGVLPHTMSLAVRSKDPALLTPYEALLRSFSYAERVTAEEHVAAKAALKRAVGQSPNSSDCWAMLSILQTDGNIHGLDPAPDSLDDALQSAQRAVDIAPTNHKAYQALAWVRYFRKEFQPSLKAAERAIALNPMDGGALVYVGQTIAFAGDWERGCSLVLRAAELNPNHAGWYWYTPFLNAYRQNDYHAALDFALKINMPGFPLACIALAAAHGQLGEAAAAQRALRELLTLRPNYASLARADLRKIWNDQLVEHLIEGLRKAGLEVPGEAALSPGAAPSRRGSGETRTAEGFWVAVLPFKYMGGNTDLKALAEGLTEEVITGLSRFSYLRVIARGSTAKYSSESGDVRAIGKELGARYVMEGSLRQAGSKLRLAVQVVDTVSGVHLWAHTYERNFALEAIFDLQDDLVPCIVSTVADQNGVLPRSISDVLRSQNEETLSPHQALLRGFSYFGRITPEEHAVVRRVLERAVHEAPDQADCWAMLSMMYMTEYADDFNTRPNAPHPLERALAAAERAVDLAPTHSLGYYALAFVHFFRRETIPFRAAVEQALKLNPMDGAAIGMLGLLMEHAGEAEEGVRLVETGMRLNPNYPPVLRFAIFVKAYRQGKYAEALEAAVRIKMPGFFHAPAARAAALGQLGQREAAQKAVQELLAVRPDFVAHVRRDYGKWWDPQMVEHLIDGLRKAGLEIPESG